MKNFLMKSIIMMICKIYNHIRLYAATDEMHNPKETQNISGNLIKQKGLK